MTKVICFRKCIIGFMDMQPIHVLMRVINNLSPVLVLMLNCYSQVIVSKDFAIFLGYKDMTEVVTKFRTKVKQR